MTENKKDPVGISLLFILFLLLGVIGVIYYRSIDWDVLKRLEQSQLILPTPVVNQTETATPSSTNSATPRTTKQ